VNFFFRGTFLNLAVIAISVTNFSVLKTSVVALVSHYTREAGVRTLERRLGALCRAVAVRVAEMNSKDNAAEEPEKVTLSEEGCEPTLTEEIAETETTNLRAIPPQLPIVLDESALEDILGVGFHRVIEIYRMSRECNFSSMYRSFDIISGSV